MDGGREKPRDLIVADHFEHKIDAFSTVWTIGTCSDCRTMQQTDT